MHDKAHIIAAYKILDLLDDEGENVLTQAKSVLDAKASRVFGDEFTIDDALKALVD